MKKKNKGEFLYSKSSVNKFNKKINLLGVSNTYNAINLLNIRFISSILIFFVLLYFLDFGYLIAPIVTIVYYIFFLNIFIDPKIKKREKQLEKDSMYFFEILVLSLEAGRGIKLALEITCDSVSSDLSNEFKKVLSDINLGKNFDEAIDDLKYRIPSDSINNIILNIKQANIFGNDITETVYAQLDFIREKRIMDTKARISKIPVKISVVSVIFFIPLLILLLLGPMIINLLN